MRGGFTLVEIVVALLLLEVAVLASLGTMVVAARTHAEADRMERAVATVEGVVDSLSGVAAPSTGFRDDPGGGVLVTWTLVDSMSAEVVATGPAGAVLLQLRMPLQRP